MTLTIKIYEYKTISQAEKTILYCHCFYKEKTTL